MSREGERAELPNVMSKTLEKFKSSYDESKKLNVSRLEKLTQIASLNTKLTERYIASLNLIVDISKALEVSRNMVNKKLESLTLVLDEMRKEADSQSKDVENVVRVENETLKQVQTQLDENLNAINKSVLRESAHISELAKNLGFENLNRTHFSQLTP